MALNGSTSKRKVDLLIDNLAKRRKREECPHKERCYRRNPHHFKEYDHAFLNDLIKMGDSITIPENMPQPNKIYLEQIAILKPILTSEICMQDNELNNSTTEESLEIPQQSLDIKMKDEPGCSMEKNVKIQAAEVPKSSEFCTKIEPGSMLDKLQRNTPYNLFFTTIPKSPDTLKAVNSVTFTDLLCPSLGQLKCSLQINFMIDIGWLMEQYKARNLHEKPLTILYGDDWPDMIEYMNRFCPNVKHHFVRMNDPFGCHHSKIGIYAYEDESIRVVISTANLYYEDWNHYNQGLWLSLKLPKLPNGSDPSSRGESPTGFKADMIKYLESYKIAYLEEWINYVQNADFSDVKVALVYSAPGKYLAGQNGNHLHKVGDLLSKYCTLPTKTDAKSEGPISWGIMAQASSLGFMGKSAAEWLRTALLRSLASHKKSPLPMNSQASLNIIYPSGNNVVNGYFGLQSGGCLPYTKAINMKQPWLQSYMHQWIAEETNRSRAMPHIKCYCRVSPCLTKLAYFLLTSGNLSKSAWGGPLQKNGSSYVRSYEMGVMFLPEFFDEDYFEIRKTELSKNKQLFPFMYDLPLTPYKKDDYPWCN